MLRLQNGEVIYNNSENLGAVELMNFKQDYDIKGFSINLPNNSVEFIPEEDCTLSEQEVFQAYHEFFRDTGGVKPPPETDIEVIKIQKIQELDVACNTDIQSGFYAEVNGINYLWGFDEKTDQPNLNQQLTAIASGISLEVFYWKPKGDLIPIQVTINQFKEMCKAAQTSKVEKIEKFWGLKATVLSCETLEEVGEIEW